MNRVAILGSGEYATHVARMCLDIAETSVVGFVDGSVPKGTMVAGLPVVGRDEDVDSLVEQGVMDSIFIGIGYEHFDVRARLFERFCGTVPIASIVHPTANVSPTARVGRGVLISEGAIVGRDCVLGDNVSVWPGVLLSHDCSIGRHSYLAPRATLAGRVAVGEKCFLGLNCSVRDGVNIGEEATVGIGCVVIGDVGDNEVVVGNPHRTLRIREGGGTGSSQCHRLPGIAIACKGERMVA